MRFHPKKIYIKYKVGLDPVNALLLSHIKIQHTPTTNEVNKMEMYEFYAILRIVFMFLAICGAFYAIGFITDLIFPPKKKKKCTCENKCCKCNNDDDGPFIGIGIGL